MGKTTLARELSDAWSAGAAYLDLEDPRDLRRLEDPADYLRRQAPQLTIIDEVHRKPELMEVLRGVIDENRRQGFRTGQFLLLGSASLDLLKSSESLAGRISYLELGGINADEATDSGLDMDSLWVRGGFPESLTAPTERTSYRWRTDLLTSYLQRDIPMFAPRIPAETLRRLWVMLAHGTGGMLNASRLGENLGVAHTTADRYVDLLVDLGLVRRLEPWFVNIGKRVRKAPKLHVRDSGLLHALLEIRNAEELLGHPVVGASYESFVVETLIDAVGDAYQPYHYRTARGDEADLVLVRGGQPRIAVEIKRSSAPSVPAGFRRAADDLEVGERYLVHPGDPPTTYASGNVTVIDHLSLVQLLRSHAE